MGRFALGWHWKARQGRKVSRAAGHEQGRMGSEHGSPGLRVVTEADWMGGWWD